MRLLLALFLVGACGDDGGGSALDASLQDTCQFRVDSIAMNHGHDPGTLGTTTRGNAATFTLAGVTHSHEVRLTVELLEMLLMGGRSGTMTTETASSGTPHTHEIGVFCCAIGC